MVFSDVPTMETLMLTKLKDYAVGHEVKLLSTFSSIKIEGDCFVLSWCSSVLEGVDMWFSNGDSQDNPR
jgi:hypothetical protein